MDTLPTEVQLRVLDHLDCDGILDLIRSGLCHELLAIVLDLENTKFDEIYDQVIKHLELDIDINETNSDGVFKSNSGLVITTLQVLEGLEIYDNFHRVHTFFTTRSSNLERYLDKFFIKDDKLKVMDRLVSDWKVRVVFHSPVSSLEISYFPLIQNTDHYLKFEDIESARISKTFYRSNQQLNKPHDSFSKNIQLTKVKHLSIYEFDFDLSKHFNLDTLISLVAAINDHQMKDCYFKNLKTLRMVNFSEISNLEFPSLEEFWWVSSGTATNISSIKMPTLKSFIFHSYGTELKITDFQCGQDLKRADLDISVSLYNGNDYSFLGNVTDLTIETQMMKQALSYLKDNKIESLILRTMDAFQDEDDVHQSEIYDLQNDEFRLPDLNHLKIEIPSLEIPNIACPNLESIEIFGDGVGYEEIKILDKVKFSNLKSLILRPDDEFPEYFNKFDSLPQADSLTLVNYYGGSQTSFNLLNRVKILVLCGKFTFNFSGLTSLQTLVIHQIDDFSNQPVKIPSQFSRVRSLIIDGANNYEISDVYPNLTTLALSDKVEGLSIVDSGLLNNLQRVIYANREQISAFKLKESELINEAVEEIVVTENFADYFGIYFPMNDS